MVGHVTVDRLAFALPVFQLARDPVTVSVTRSLITGVTLHIPGWPAIYGRYFKRLHLPCGKKHFPQTLTHK